MSYLNYRVTFFSVVDDGPEAGMSEFKEIYQCSALMYEPTQKDVQLGNLELEKNSVVLNIRNAYPQYTPRVKEVFTVHNGIYAGMSFNIKNVAPAKKSGYVKVVGEEL